MSLEVRTRRELKLGEAHESRMEPR
jgi:hypothetical protein